MSYENPVNVSYGWTGLNLASGTTRVIKPPKGLSKGNIIDVHASVTVTFTQVTTPAYVRIGISGTPAYYAEVNMGAAAAASAYNLRDNGTISRRIDLAADGVSSVLVTFVAPTGGSPAGTADFTIVIGWF